MLLVGEDSESELRTNRCFIPHGAFPRRRRCASRHRHVQRHWRRWLQAGDAGRALGKPCDVVRHKPPGSASRRRHGCSMHPAYAARRRRRLPSPHTSNPLYPSSARTAAWTAAAAASTTAWALPTYGFSRWRAAGGAHPSPTVVNARKRTLARRKTGPPRAARAWTAGPTACCPHPAR